MIEGKIIKAVSGFYYVLHEDGITQCRGRGVFRKQGITPLVGDFVSFKTEKGKDGYLMEIKPRKNELVRPPVANVDQAILVFSAVQPDFNTVLLDRFLVLIESNDITPIICITKVDLIERENRNKIEQFATDYETIGYNVLLTSPKTMEGMEQLRPLLNDKVSVVAGQSGVGKSSLLNALVPGLSLKTSDISDHLGRGKHTTRHVEFIPFANGFIADTPGFSSLDFFNIELEDLGDYFPEIRERKNECKFRGCMHLSEPQCAVKKAVKQHEILDYRYQHYVEFLQEIKARKERY